MWYRVVGTGISISVVSCIVLGDIEIHSITIIAGKDLAIVADIVLDYLTGA